MRLLPEVMDAIVAANPGIAVSERGVIARVVWAERLTGVLAAEADTVTPGTDGLDRIRARTRATPAEAEAAEPA